MKQNERHNVFLVKKNKNRTWGLQTWMRDFVTKTESSWVIQSFPRNVTRDKRKGEENHSPLPSDYPPEQFPKKTLQ